MIRQIDCEVALWAVDAGARLDPSDTGLSGAGVSDSAAGSCAFGVGDCSSARATPSQRPTNKIGGTECQGIKVLKCCFMLVSASADILDATVVANFVSLNEFGLWPSHLH